MPLNVGIMNNRCNLARGDHHALDEKSELYHSLDEKDGPHRAIWRVTALATRVRRAGESIRVGLLPVTYAVLMK